MTAITAKLFASNARKTLLTALHITSTMGPKAAVGLHIHYTKETEFLRRQYDRIICGNASRMFEPFLLHTHVCLGHVCRQLFA